METAKKIATILGRDPWGGQLKEELETSGSIMKHESGMMMDLEQLGGRGRYN
jgi:hypothetical protein